MAHALYRFVTQDISRFKIAYSYQNSNMGPFCIRKQIAFPGWRLPPKMQTSVLDRPKSPRVNWLLETETETGRANCEAKIPQNMLQALSQRHRKRKSRPNIKDSSPGNTRWLIELFIFNICSTAQWDSQAKTQNITVETTLWLFFLHQTMIVRKERLSRANVVKTWKYSAYYYPYK